jgi:hypothetical protein
VRFFVSQGGEGDFVGQIVLSFTAAVTAPFALALVAGACSPEAPQAEQQPPPPVASSPPPDAPSPPPAPADASPPLPGASAALPEPEDGAPRLLITDPAELMELEKAGLTFARQLGARADDPTSLLKAPRYASFVAVIQRDLNELSAREGVARRQFPLDPARLNYVFNVDWLRSPQASFELVGLAHRLDQQFATPGQCGQLRLVYRLTLHPENRAPARLPMTVNVIRVLRKAPAGGCREAARQWRELYAPSTSPEGRAAAVAGAIALLPAVSRVETNYQNLHGPGTPYADDHAEYVLRSFDVRGSKLVPRLLLNTPRSSLDAGERRALARWIAASFRDIDAGRAVVPDRFLATRAVSFSPRGLARPGNRVFAGLFPPAVAEQAFAGLDYSAAALIRSPRGLIRRLDELTCAGCHQSRALAGFHLPGEERDAARTFDALAVGVSAHLREELGWRGRLFASVESGKAFDEPRPFAERGAPGAGQYGAHCGRGDPTFAGWTCGAGLDCRAAYRDEIGFCAPAAREDGDACEDARVVARASAAGDDKVTDSPEACAPGWRGGNRCVTNRFGFPLGLCTAACGAAGERHGSSVCQGMLASGYEQVCFPLAQPIEECVQQRKLVAVQTTRLCSPDAPCRDDYGCVRFAGSAPGVGGCVPPYFLFSFRVDGPVMDR